MKWLRRSLGAFRNGLVLIVLLAMLAFNVASFAVTGLHAAMSNVAEAIFGRSAVAFMGQQITSLNANNQSLEKRNRQLATELKTSNANLKTASSDLKASRADLDSTRSELKNTRADLTASRRNLTATRAELSKSRRLVDNSTRRIAVRVIRGAGRSIAAVPMEVLPVVGAATVVAVTALEIKDACDSLQDMQDIRVASGIDEEEQDWASRVCGKFTSPGVPEVCDMTITQCREHAQRMRERLGVDFGDEVGDEIMRQCDALIMPDPEICRPPEQTSPVQLPEP